MLKYDGTVDYYLNDNDLTKKADNTASDVANTSYGGNAMMEWGQDGYRVHWKLVPDNDGKGFTFVVGNNNLMNLAPWNHCDCEGGINKHFYVPIFFGTDINNVLRSLSGQTGTVNVVGTTEISHAEANNQTSAKIWTTELYVDRLLIDMMLPTLIGKSTDHQSVFGTGRCGSTNSTYLGTGTMNDKGLFYGKNNNTDGVKLFGRENPYGNLWRRIQGYVIKSGGEIFIKLTYRTQDGSTSVGYNNDGTGYISNGTLGSNPNDSYITSMHISSLGIAPIVGGGSSSTYYCDQTMQAQPPNNTTHTPLCGGDYNIEAGIPGGFCINCRNSITIWADDTGGSISCKPLAA
jgi:hypothetical protein